MVTTLPEDPEDLDGPHINPNLLGPAPTWTAGEA
jgi:hypothetical protein